MDMSALREHYTANEIIGLLAHAAGLLPEAAPTAAEALIKVFDWAKVPREDIIIGAIE